MKSQQISRRNLQLNMGNVRINDGLNKSKSLLPGTNEDDFLHMEDYDANLDAEFIKKDLVPYFSDLYKDMLMRSN